MAIVFLTLNGVGIGHLSRAFVFCEAVKIEGYNPVVFSQGIYPPHFREKFPGKTIKSLGRATQAEQLSLVREIASYAGSSQPAIVFEDTHPASIKFAHYIQRILIVRPTTFRYLSWLAKNYGSSFRRFLVCDHPESPTWTFPPHETDEILSWKDWEFAGPVFRQLFEQNFETVRRRYALTPEQRVYVFTMGGGGRPSENDPDITTFRHKATEVAELLRAINPACRLIFVRGPLFPGGIQLPDLFESVNQEPCMAELLAVADGAVIRPGYNTVWECLRSSTHFFSIPGTTYMEPVEDRLNKLDRLGLSGSESISSWGDRDWKSAFMQRSQKIVTRWTGNPDRDLIRRVLDETPRIRLFPAQAGETQLLAVDEEALEHAREQLVNLKSDKRLLVRTNEVIELDDSVKWILQECRSRNLFASLEVVPYLSTFAERDLDLLDPGELFEVAQHGYANIARLDTHGYRGEFWLQSESEFKLAVQEITAGFARLSAAFPKRFRMGFSAPYDGLPEWLEAVWQKIGGRYLSVIRLHPPTSRLPAIRFGTELRNWKANQPRRIDDIMTELTTSMAECGYAGLVVHPRLIPDPLERVRLVRILDTLVDGEVTSKSPSTFALREPASF